MISQKQARKILKQLDADTREARSCGSPPFNSPHIRRGKPTPEELAIERGHAADSDQGLYSGLDNGAFRKMPVRYE